MKKNIKTYSENLATCAKLFASYYWLQINTKLLPTETMRLNFWHFATKTLK